jgi:20S proteasome subunit alpha 6
MRQQAMSSRMLYGRPIPVARIMQGIADRKSSPHLGALYRV